jgi:hypothetical protein
MMAALGFENNRCSMLKGLPTDDCSWIVAPETIEYWRAGFRHRAMFSPEI